MHLVDNHAVDNLTQSRMSPTYWTLVNRQSYVLTYRKRTLRGVSSDHQSMPRFCLQLEWEVIHSHSYQVSRVWMESEYELRLGIQSYVYSAIVIWQVICHVMEILAVSSTSLLSCEFRRLQRILLSQRDNTGMSTRHTLIMRKCLLFSTYLGVAHIIICKVGLTADISRVDLLEIS